MAKSSAVITIPGVLMQIVSSAPIQTGLQLYHGLATTFNLLLVTDETKEKTDHWLRLENLTKHGTVLYGDKKRLDQVNLLRSRGFAIDLVVEPDPAIAAELLRNGYSVCNYLHFSYAFPSWRPDYEGERKGWEEIERQVTQDRIMRSEDTRLDPDNTELL
jgi:hypothetical protein